MDTEKVKRKEKVYKKIPVITDFTDENGNDRMKETVQANQGGGEADCRRRAGTDYQRRKSETFVIAERVTLLETKNG